MYAKPIRKWLLSASIVLLWLLGPAADEAQAYIDPGTGSSLLPSLGIMLAVMSAFLAIAFTQVKRFAAWVWFMFTMMVRKVRKAHKN